MATHAETIRPGVPGDAEQLREIAFAAKAHWGYDRERVRAWADGGDFSPQAFGRSEVAVAEVRGQIVGWASVIPRGDVWWLDDLWITPGWMGRGIGRRLFEWAAECARAGGARRMEWDAEPHAIGFYQRVGAHYMRDGEPSDWGRALPVMAVDLHGGDGDR